MNIEKYYLKAESGCGTNNREIVSYISSFSNVVIWGASYLGQEIAKYLIRVGILDFIWWDTRADEIGMIDDIPIIPPFPDNEVLKKKNTLVILGIGNTAIMQELLNHLSENGYYNILRGDKLFMGEICPFSISTGINGTICNGTMTCRSMFCSRLHNIIREKYSKNGLFLPNLTIMVTTNCSLKCKYCCAYMNSYPKEKRVFFPYEQIARDIDSIFSVTDAIGSITVQGGEPFLHPDIHKIIRKLLEKPNFGIVSVATNGIFTIKKDNLADFQDDRLNVAFSGYYDALPEDKLNIYYKNIQLLKESNIPVTVGVKMPEWAIPSTLWNRNYSEEIITSKKANCRIPDRCLQIMNGRLYPCLFSLSLHGIGVADYPKDYVELTDSDLLERIKKMLDRPFYDSCRHCSGIQGNTSIAGEQGFYDFITPNREGIRENG
jgi:organic radical activating enzyme